MVGIISEMESVPGSPDETVVVDGHQLRLSDVSELTGPGPGVDRLLIYWETDAGPYFVVSVQSTASDCYNLRSAAAFDVSGGIVFVWSEQPSLGVRLPKEPGFQPRLDDPDGTALVLPIEICLDEHGVVQERD
ncbi:MAG: hypothetical protein ACRDG7_03590 [Candidatus Limnocylindria bacterium]